MKMPGFGLLSQSSLDFTYLAGLIGIFVAVFIIAHMLMSEEIRSAASENIADLRDRKASNGLVKIARPFITQYVVPMIRGKAMWESHRIRYKRMLITAGLSEELTPDEFISFKFFLILFFPIALLGLNRAGLMDISLLWVFVAAVVGFIYPDFWAKSLIQRRQKEILKSLPFIVDLLALSTEAGLDFIGAMQKVVEKANPSPLVDEIGQVLKEIKVGSARAEALREMATRIGMQSINSFVAILISSDQMGASIGKILRQQSEQIRAERMLRAEKAGAKAATQVMLPAIFLLFPAILLMVGGPFVIQFMSGGGSVP